MLFIKEKVQVFYTKVNSSNLRILLTCVFIGSPKTPRRTPRYLFIFYFKRILLWCKAFKTYEMFLDVIAD